ncbi:E3 ubiquitin-protein ligase RNF103 [Aplysia californica]|uniref:E3 ubiquitin-protein ligase RNF103 n=1 Tax=Aplysia californica TaxID=6500 RepID=A0ABM1VUS3_APLCA|nr:E3 ubiquitin-protein ligase RNF103 [Aplysia californica]XP_035826165.1 E3 ubiquitin-protein ligase RNF103 [Aplysia californica]
MWLKVFLLMAYILLLFVLSRVLEALSWCEVGYGGVLSRQLLDPMALSVAKLKALLEQRGVSYEHVVEKSELTSLVESSGQLTSAEVELATAEEKTVVQTNFTSGAHFIEQVEDAKDSVWLVQVVLHQDQLRIVGDARWKAVRRKVSKFGVHTGLLDCSLDIRYCDQKGWRSPFLLLALPSQFEKKASIAMHNYSGPVREAVVMHWLRDRLAERLEHITDPVTFHYKWQNFTKDPLDPEIHAVLFTKASRPPLFYSALSVKFPGRVKFGIVNLNSPVMKLALWNHVLQKEKIWRLPAYVVYSAEGKYVYGHKGGEHFSFTSMERFLKFLHPCLNDVFIISFCVANIMSWFEPLISNCGILKRFRKLIWCTFKYNIIVIMLWLPIIGIFQMPYLDRVPLSFLKLERMFSTSYLGTIFRGDCAFYFDRPLYIYVTFILYLVAVTLLCKRYRENEDEAEDWFNFSHMATLAHLRPNDFIEPMRISGYDLIGGLEVFGSRLSQPSLWLQPTISSEYIQYLPTWRYTPVPIAKLAAENAARMHSTLTTICKTSSSNTCCVASSTHNTETVHHCKLSHQDTLSVPAPSSTSNPEICCVCASCFQSSKNFAVSGNCQVQASVSSPNPTEATGSGADPLSQPHCKCHPCCSHHTPAIAAYSSSVTSQSQSQKPPYASMQENLSTGPCCSPTQPTKNESQSVPVGQTSESLGTSHQGQSAQLSERPATSNNSGVSVSTISSTTPCSTLSSNASSSTNLNTLIQSNGFPSSSTAARGLVIRPSGFPPGYVESHQCVICLEEYVPLTVLCGLPCGHVFHETCIFSWLNREKHFCPMCRWPSYKLPETASGRM